MTGPGLGEANLVPDPLKPVVVQKSELVYSFTLKVERRAGANGADRSYPENPPSHPPEVPRVESNVWLLRTIDLTSPFALREDHLRSPPCFV